jgi:hypothetical protein
MSEKLLPCPFCGGVPELNDYRTAPAGAWVMVHRAKGCVIAPLVDQFPTEEAAIAAWNRRTPAPEGEACWPHSYETDAANQLVHCVDCGMSFGSEASPVVPVGVSREEIAFLISDSVFADDATEFTGVLHGIYEAADAILAALRPTDTGREA